MKSILFVGIGTALGLSVFAQTNLQSQVNRESSGQPSTYVAGMTTRTVEAINYRYRGGAADVELAGTRWSSDRLPKK